MSDDAPQPSLPTMPHAKGSLWNLTRDLDRKSTTLLLALLATSIWCAYLLVLRVLHLLDLDAHHGDAAFYFTIGQAIVNGFVPYADIFDPKPPGVFLLSATSILLFGNHLLGNLLSIVMLLLPGPLLARFALREASSARPPERLILLLAGCVAGAVLALWNSVQAGAWQPESFGNFFGFLYVLLLAARRDRLTFKGVVMASICLFFAMGFKEPFFLTLLAAALVIDHRRAALWRTFFLPVLLALGAGAAVLWVFGWLDEYLGLYLPTILGIRIQYETPLWLRGLFFWKTHAALSHASFLLLPSLLLLTSWRAWDIIRSGERTWTALAALLAAAYISVTAVALGGNYEMHSYAASLIPLATALVALLLRRMGEELDAYGTTLFATGAIALAIVAWSFTPARVLQEMPQQERARIEALKDAGRSLDSLLVACKVDRYLYAVKPAQPLLPAYTKKSPLNHFPYREIDKITFGFPFLRESLERLSEANVLLLNPQGFITSDDGLGGLMGQYIRQSFTATAPDCAKPFLPIEGYQVVFRTSNKRIAVSEVTDEQGNTMLNFEY